MGVGQKLAALRQRMRQANWYLISGVSFLLLVLIALAYAGWKLELLLNDAEALPIQAVAVKGERRYTSDEQIRLALQDLMQRSFFSADVMEVQKALEALPWVYKASVRRDWPAKLKVYLQEQTPVAHWNATGWLNEHGEVFAAPQEEELETLPWLSGPDERGLDVLTAYKQMEELLRINSFHLQKLHLSPRLAWEAELGNGIVLDLGREDKMSRIQRFINVYPEMLKQDKSLARVDLRYDTGLAVGWEASQKESQ
ncbi:cell division protein FtsQ/DivIB [Shewanella avicenniae]|uniref:Cell division protein FtsQ n=1 Tax=Shewanella avicenniae TaxID=2814294 RepID=A0ABX7QTI4_9GAMM|nr:cell division protein FtsQ/DivIB [Shewanella avicenniae]QSX33995.1 cell division protein FtsQ/DivIB [Shewanella avicenniae]